MRRVRYIAFEPRQRSLLVKIAGFIGGLVVLGVAIVLGAFLLAALLGLGLLIAVAVYARLWWLRRTLTTKARSDDGVIETEYEVVTTRKRQGRDRSNQ